MTRLLCIADLHLGKCPSGVDQAERLAEQEAVWAQALRVGEERGVDAVLFAGDLFEGPIPTPEHYAAFARPLRESSLPVVAISGNGRHDAAMRDTNAVGMLDALDIPRLQLFTRPTVTHLPGLAVACLPWAPVSRLVAASDGGDRDTIHQDAADVLLGIARGLRDQAVGPRILLTHFSISGATLPGGMTSDQLREVVLPLPDLELLGFDAIVAGHLHPPQILTSELGGGPTFYCGSPLPLDFGEGGTEHGVWILDIGADEWTTRFVPLESRRFVTFDADVQETGDYGPMWETLLPPDIDGAYLTVRYTVTAEQARRIQQDDIVAAALDLGAHQVWVKPTIVRESRARVAALDETVSDTDALDLWLGMQEMGDDAKVALRRMHAEYVEGVATSSR